MQYNYKTDRACMECEQLYYGRWFNLIKKKKLIIYFEFVFLSSSCHKWRRKSPCGKKVMIEENQCKVDIPLTRNIDPQILEFFLFTYHHDHKLLYAYLDLYSLHSLTHNLSTLQHHIISFSYPQSIFPQNKILPLALLRH